MKTKFELKKDIVKKKFELETAIMMTKMSRRAASA